MNSFENSGHRNPVESGRDPHEVEAAFTEELKQRFSAIESGMRKVEGLAAASAANPDGGMGFSEDLTEAIQAVNAEYEDLIAFVVERGQTRGEKTDTNGDLFAG